MLLSVYNKSIKDGLLKIKKAGFFSVFLSNVLAKLAAFLGGTLLVNILTKSDYGTYSYIINTLSILSLLGDCGAANATMQFSSENATNDNKRNAFISLGFRICVISSLLSCALVLFSKYFYPYSIKGAEDLTSVLFLIPIIVNINTFILGIIRSHLRNRRFAFINLFSTCIHYIIIIPFSYLGGLVGAVIAQYFFNGATLFVGLVLSFTLFKFIKYKNELSKSEIKGFFKFSIATQINSTIDSFLISADLFLIGLIIANSEVIASYKTASILPNAMLFLPTSIMIFLVPYFARNNKNINWIRKNTKVLICFSIIVFGFITLLSIIFAPIIITTIFGEKYTDSILCFRILMIGFFFTSTFKLPLNNIIYTMKKIRVNISVTLISGLINIILDPFLIIWLGSVGAAITTCVVMTLNSVFVLCYIRQLLKREVQ